tara:strand:+ start:3161 stop:3415 length:255 start_codon:yes stop_codon:yes gene_type:complete
MATKPKLTAAKQRELEAKVAQMEAEKQAAVDAAFEAEQDAKVILDAAKAACLRASSVGEIRRIRRMANEKVKLIGQLSRKEDWL